MAKKNNQEEEQAVSLAELPSIELIDTTYCENQVVRDKSVKVKGYELKEILETIHQINPKLLLKFKKNK